MTHFTDLSGQTFGHCLVLKKVASITCHSHMGYET
jgi:hypothetical protein